MLCQAGRYQASHLLATDYWPSIEALREDSGPFRLTFWKALQLHQYLHSLLNPQGFCRNMTTFEEYCSDGGTVLSKTYNLLMSSTEQTYLKKWQTDLNHILLQNNKIILDFP